MHPNQLQPEEREAWRAFFREGCLGRPTATPKQGPPALQAWGPNDGAQLRILMSAANSPAAPGSADGLEEAATMLALAEQLMKEWLDRADAKWQEGEWREVDLLCLQVCFAVEFAKTFSRRLKAADKWRDLNRLKAMAVEMGEGARKRVTASDRLNDETPPWN